MEVTKPVRWPVVTLAIVFLAFGVAYLILKFNGYVLLPINREAPAALSTVITAVMVLLTIKGVKSKDRADKLTKIFAKTMPISAIIFVIGKGIGYVTDGIELTLLPIYGCIALACSLIVFFTYSMGEKPRKKLWVICIVIYIILMVPMYCWLVLWDFSPKPVVGEELSPNGAYLAEVVISDQVFWPIDGAVQVTQQNRDIQLAVGWLAKEPTQVCLLNYEKTSTVQLSWESDGVLCVDGERFEIGG